ncbi:MAG: signal peptidase II [Limosilactobacillus sp.]|uniref:signal peptidase II n=1 Tax=Limosilactobacillus sp. TaxID=2773925 RepID=UPI0026FE0F3A|nr:signal peptidase II [Limosilactobacillus sp.]
MPVVAYLLLTVALIIIDQVVKHWVSIHIALNSGVKAIPGLLAITNLHNDGAAWSMLEGQQGIFTAISIVAILVVGYFFYRWRKRPLLVLPIAIILAGTIGNFIDRLTNGYVVDMFEVLFINFPVFNVADICLTVGVLWLVIMILKEEE